MNGDVPEAVIQLPDLLGLDQVPDVNGAVLRSGENPSVRVVEYSLDPVARLVFVADVFLKKFSGRFVEESDGFAGGQADKDALPVSREGHRGHRLGADKV